MFKFNRLDYLGIWLSVLCLAHCLVLPAVLMALPILARYYLAHPLMHLGFAFFVSPIAIISLWSGYRFHLKKWIFMLGVLGSFLVALASLSRVISLEVAKYELYYTVSGSLLLILAHLWNIRCLKTCQTTR